MKKTDNLKQVFVKQGKPMNFLSLYLKPMPIMVIGLLFLYLLNPFNYGYVPGYILTGLIFINKSFIVKNLDGDFFLLLLFSFIYALFYSFDYESQGKQFIAIYAITPPFFYLTGKYLTKDKPSPQILFYLLFGTGVIFSLSALISVFLNYLDGGFAQIERTIGMFWDNRPVSATGMGAFFTMNMCIPALLILSKGKKSKIFNMTGVIIFIITLICTIRLGSRTQLGIFLIMTALSVFYMLPKQSFKQSFILFNIIGITIYYISTKVSFNLNADWLTTFAGRMENGSSDIASGGGRTERWVKSFEYLFTHPLGWEVNEFGYSHNLWLDVLRLGGVLPFFILIIFTIKSFNKIKQVTSLNPKNTYFNGQVLVYALSFLLLFMVEPIMEGAFTSFVLFCLFMGIINKYNDNILNDQRLEGVNKVSS
ncbi:hypothetical protein CLV90_1831 [Maribacter spongiicola]|uniref:O-antigen ligase n=1 Tax=Maribacter spongiicola TaxID=1206753 RepID=A0A4R7K402_9FLAO|nr:hypothetical protein [Maribacter spongiicola]TDT44753.1 hypothetical protein CLV90_1831 [Maribacter spongiicola]